MCSDRFNEMWTTAGDTDIREYVDELYLYDNCIEEMSAGALTFWYNLKILDLRKNKIKLFYPSQFTAQGDQPFKIEQLLLEDNELGTAKDGEMFDTEASDYVGFDKLTELLVLRLGSNFIKRLHKDTFAKLHKLRILHLENNELLDLDLDLFAFNDLAGLAGVNQLEELHLQRNNLKELKAGIFRKLDKLRVVYIQVNPGLRAIPRGVFVNGDGGDVLPALVRLKMEGSESACRVERDPVDAANGLNRIECGCAVGYAPVADEKAKAGSGVLGQWCERIECHSLKAGADRADTNAFNPVFKVAPPDEAEGGKDVEYQYQSDCIGQLGDTCYVKCKTGYSGASTDYEADLGSRYRCHYTGEWVWEQAFRADQRAKLGELDPSDLVIADPFDGLVCEERRCPDTIPAMETPGKKVQYECDENSVLYGGPACVVTCPKGFTPKKTATGEKLECSCTDPQCRTEEGNTCEPADDVIGHNLFTCSGEDPGDKNKGLWVGYDQFDCEEVTCEEKPAFSKPERFMYMQNAGTPEPDQKCSNNKFDKSCEAKCNPQFQVGKSGDSLVKYTCDEEGDWRPVLSQIDCRGPRCDRTVATKWPASASKLDDVSCRQGELPRKTGDVIVSGSEASANACVKKCSDTQSKRCNAIQWQAGSKTCTLYSDFQGSFSLWESRIDLDNHFCYGSPNTVSRCVGDISRDGDDCGLTCTEGHKPKVDSEFYNTAKNYCSKFKSECTTFFQDIYGTQEDADDNCIFDALGKTGELASGAADNSGYDTLQCRIDHLNLNRNVPLPPGDNGASRTGDKCRFASLALYDCEETYNQCEGGKCSRRQCLEKQKKAYCESDTGKRYGCECEKPCRNGLECVPCIADSANDGAAVWAIPKLECEAITCNPVRSGTVAEPGIKEAACAEAYEEDEQDCKANFDEFVAFDPRTKSTKDISGDDVIAQACAGSNTYGKVCEVSCKHGYGPKSAQFKCESDQIGRGVWVGLLGDAIRPCSPIQCPATPLFDPSDRCPEGQSCRFAEFDPLSKLSVSVPNNASYEFHPVTPPQFDFECVGTAVAEVYDVDCNDPGWRVLVPVRGKAKRLELKQNRTAEGSSGVNKWGVGDNITAIHPIDQQRRT